MDIDVHITDGPLPAVDPAPPDPAAGAVLSFDGIVRPREEDREIVALDYEAYEPMAGRELRTLAEDVARRHGVLAIHARHSRGRVGVGECSFWLRVASRHRKEGIAALDEFIDRMKRDVPIWKTPVYGAGVMR